MIAWFHNLPIGWFFRAIHTREECFLVFDGFGIVAGGYMLG